MKNQAADIVFSTDDSLSKEEALHLILNNIDDFFFLLDKNLKIICINDQTKLRLNEFMGVNVTEGTSILEIISPERRSMMLDLYQEVLNGDERTSESKFYPDGQERIFENHLKPARNRNGEVV